MYKIIFFILLLSFVLTSCSIFLGTAFFQVDTKRFAQMEQKEKLKKEDAWKIYTAYCKQKQIHQDTARKGFLIGMFNHKYVFMNRFSASGKLLYFHGSVYVNAKTGKARYIRRTWRNVVFTYCQVWRGDEDSTSNKHKGDSQ